MIVAIARQLRVLVPLVALCASPMARAADTADEVADAAGRITLMQAHSFSRSEARARITMLLDYWSQRFGLKRTWNGDVARIEGKVMGVPFDGEVVVTDHDVSAVTSDPGSVFRTAAVKYVRQKLKKYLHKDYEED